MRIELNKMKTDTITDEPEIEELSAMEADEDECCDVYPDRLYRNLYFQGKYAEWLHNAGWQFQ